MQGIANAFWGFVALPAHRARANLGPRDLEALSASAVGGISKEEIETYQLLLVARASPVLP